MNRTETNRWCLLLTGPAFVYYLGVLRLLFSIPLPHDMAKAGHLQFLTNWALAFAVLSFAISSLTYITRLKFMWKVRREFHPVALVICSIVAFVYWPLRVFMLDRMVANVDQFNVALIFDISLHLLPTLILIAEFLLFMPDWRLTWFGASIWSSSLTYAYWWVLHRIVDREQGMRFPYVFLEVPTPARIVIFVVIGSAGYALFFVYRALHHLLVKQAPVKAKQS